MLAAVLGLVLVVRGSVEWIARNTGVVSRTRLHNTNPMDLGSAPLGTVSIYADHLAARVGFVARKFRHA